MEVQRTSFAHRAPHTLRSSGGWGEEAGCEETKVPVPQGLPPSPQPRPVQVSEQRPVSHLVTLNFTWLKKNNPQGKFLPCHC